VTLTVVSAEPDSIGVHRIVAGTVGDSPVFNLSGGVWRKVSPPDVDTGDILDTKTHAFPRHTECALVDDVLNSGTTLVYGVKHFLEVPLGKFKTAVLIDRNHKKFPVKADFKGISLSTSMQEHVQVVFAETGDYAYLN
jgi:hypoxanthine phosphoribosyltransferase